MLSSGTIIWIYVIHFRVTVMWLCHIKYVCTKQWMFVHTREDATNTQDNKIKYLGSVCNSSMLENRLKNAWRQLECHLKTHWRLLDGLWRPIVPYRQAFLELMSEPKTIHSFAGKCRECSYLLFLILSGMSQMLWFYPNKNMIQACRDARGLFSHNYVYELVLGLGQHIEPSYHKLFNERSCESLKIDETYLSFFVYVTRPLTENVLFKPSLTKWTQNISIAKFGLRAPAHHDSALVLNDSPAPR